MLTQTFQNLVRATIDCRYSFSLFTFGKIPLTGKYQDLGQIFDETVNLQLRSLLNQFKMQSQFSRHLEYEVQKKKIK